MERSATRGPNRMRSSRARRGPSCGHAVVLLVIVVNASHSLSHTYCSQNIVTFLNSQKNRERDVNFYTRSKSRGAGRSQEELRVIWRIRCAAGSGSCGRCYAIKERHGFRAYSCTTARKIPNWSVAMWQRVRDRGGCWDGHRLVSAPSDEDGLRLSVPW